MARPQRIELANAFYHVSNLRKTGKALFPDKDHVALFMEQVLAAGRRFNVEIHGWYLHKNSYQLLVKTPEANLSRFMRQVDGLYTLRCQQSGWRGPVFNSRYKSVLVQPALVPHVLHFLHHQAGRNGDVALGSRSSSLGSYLGKVAWTAPVTREELGGAPAQRKRLAQTQQSVLPPEHVIRFFARKSRAAVLGDAGFVGKMRQLGGDSPTRRRTPRSRPSVHRIVARVAQEFAVPESGIVHAARGPGSKNIPRWVAMHLCQELGAVTLQVIASHFGLQRYGTVSTTIGKLKAELSSNPGLQRRLAKLVQTLS
ncbi:MAG TPA: hypothetical protein VMH83_00305 [Candidatus Acidoferrum sp.]|nr:hypothetical protein [Candidatus Acidoferrum sp.]